MSTDRRLYGYSELKPLVSPRSVAVIGASERPSFGSGVLRNLIGRGLPDGLHVVNPAHETVFGLRTIPKPDDLPESVDCAVIGVNGRLAVDLLRSCAERGVRTALVHASGFAEAGNDEGRQLQDEIVAISRDYGIRVCGPNVLGMLNFKDRILFGGGALEDLPAGRVGVVSQSGGLGIYLTQAQAEGARLFSHCLCAGNSADIDVLDFANYLLGDPDVDAVAMCMEGIGSINRLLDLGETSKKLRKPIVVFKTGRGETGARAALSHTGSVAGAYAAVQAAFRRAGLIEVATYEDIVDTAVYFSRAKPPRTKAVGVVTGMGGCAVMVCDTAEASDVALPMPSQATIDALAETVPEYGVIGNPADLTANPGGVDKFESAFKMFANDPTYDTVVFPLAPSASLTEDRPAGVRRVAATSSADVIVYWMSRWLEGPGAGALYADPNVSVFRSSRLLFEAVGKWHRWNDELSRRVRRAVDPRVQSSVSQATGAALGSLRTPGGPVSLTEVASRDLCLAAGVALVPAAVAVDPDGAAEAAGRLGYPVAMKVVSEDVPHKTEAGGVALGLGSEDDVRHAFSTITSTVADRVPGARITGVLVTPMVDREVEVIVGARRDPVTGPLVVCGLGGTLVEALGTPPIELAPIDYESALAMIDRMPGADLLGEYRGRPARDRDALARLVVAVSDLIASDPRLQEVDLNPVVVLAEGQGVTAVDALVVVDDKAIDEQPGRDGGK